MTNNRFCDLGRCVGFTATATCHGSRTGLNESLVTESVTSASFMTEFSPLKDPESDTGFSGRGLFRDDGCQPESKLQP